MVLSSSFSSWPEMFPGEAANSTEQRYANVVDVQIHRRRNGIVSRRENRIGSTYELLPLDFCSNASGSWSLIRIVSEKPRHHSRLALEVALQTLRDDSEGVDSKVRDKVASLTQRLFQEPGTENLPKIFVASDAEMQTIDFEATYTAPQGEACARLYVAAGFSTFYGSLYLDGKPKLKGRVDSIFIRDMFEVLADEGFIEPGGVLMPASRPETEESLIFCLG